MQLAPYFDEVSASEANPEPFPSGDGYLGRGQRLGHHHEHSLAIILYYQICVIIL